MDTDLTNLTFAFLRAHSSELEIHKSLNFILKCDLLIKITLDSMKKNGITSKKLVKFYRDV